MDARTVEIMGFDPQLLQLPLSVGEAVACFLRHEHPTHTAKNVARATGVDVRTAENILSGHLSALTLTKLLRTYRWRFLAAVGTATLGESYEQSIESELREIADEKRRLDEAEREARARWARTLARRSSDAGGLRLVAEADRSWSPLDRRGAGDVGAEPTPTARRVK